MNILQDENRQTTYDKCKYKVKLWENEFKKKHRRLPSKLDIREASADVRNAYKIYFRLKTAALEESLTNLEGFDVDNTSEENSTKDNLNKSATENSSVEEKTKTISKVNKNNTWGLHLNKATNLSVINKPKQEKSNVNISFSQKLFQGSKSSKRLPRKSLSFVRKKSELDDSKCQFLSQPEFAVSNSFDLGEESHVESNSITIKNSLNESPNVKQNSIINSFSSKPSRTLDPGWLKRLTQSTGIDLNNEDLNSSKTDNNKSDYDSDDVIENSEDELDNSTASYPVPKRMKLDKPASSNDIEEVNTKFIAVDETTKRLDFSNIFTKSLTQKSVNETIKETRNKLCGSSNKEIEDPSAHLKKSVLSSETTGTTSQLHRACKISNYNDELFNTENEDPFHSDDDGKDPEFTINDDEIQTNLLDSNVKAETKTKPKEINKSKKRIKGKKNEEIDDTVIDSPYELEYSVKPRTVRVPRLKSIKQVLSKNKEYVRSCSQLETKQQDKKISRLKKKISSGTLNENFVQINLKKKIYVRGKSSMTFSKYKKQQWKNKKKALYGPDMDMGGCDGGMLTCFKCGQVGHFARDCKSSKSDLLLPLSNLDTEEVYSPPTLEEASKIAQESVLCIRKPNQIKLNKKEVEKQLINNEPSEDSMTDNIFSDNDDFELLAETKRLEEQISKIDYKMFVDIAHTVKPYYELKEDGNLIDCPQEVYEALNKFGYQTFRDGQQQAIMRILSGRSTLVTLSTGSGKSLCYQLPAYLYSKREPCITLIISPLVSLMEDQVTGIPEFLGAACLHTYQTKTQKEKIMEMINTRELDILLVSPEMIVAGEKSAGFGSLLRKLPPIAFACIDEAHCVSQWSHNFRPSYLKISRVLKERLGVNTILGLTATATKVTCDSIIKHIGIPDGDDGVIQDIPIPDNLNLTISRDIQRDQALLSLLLSERFEDCKSIIIYCTRREECERVAGFLRTHLKNSCANDTENKKRKRFSLLAEPYHAGLAAGRRRTVQKAFMKNELRIVVATVAFSMGINKPDLRAVIHYNMPMSFESYVQEVGRAGRDGLPAQCHLFLDSQGKDENELLRHVYANSIDRHVIRKLLQRCFIPCSCNSTCPRHEVAIPIKETVQALDVPEENIETLLCYLELHAKRYIELLSHAYITCKLISYGDPNEIIKAAKDCPPLTMALAMYGDKSEGKNVFEFPVIEIASAIGWDSGICKHKLKNLEWTLENNQPKRSKLSVQFSNLGFRLLSPGNLSDLELDEALDSLYERVLDQERMSILQLHEIYSSLTAVAAPSYKQCLLKDDYIQNQSSLKTKIRKYFSSSTPIQLSSKLPVKPIKEEQIVSDVRALICMYRDNTFTGRAIARIFHGIQSPKYPAFIWGRCKFWRLHLGKDFNAICEIATKEILSMR